MTISPSLQLVLQLAAQEAVVGRFTQIEPEHLAMAVLKFAELGDAENVGQADGLQEMELFLDDARQIRERLRARKLQPTAARRELRARMIRGDQSVDVADLHRSPASRHLFEQAARLAVVEGADVLRPVHLLDAVLATPTPLIAEVMHVAPVRAKNAVANPNKDIPIDELSARLRGLRQELLAKVFGQDHAVHAFVEGLFNAEVVAAVDEKRQQPQAIFVFAGPPGVGKTYLATLGAEALGRPFKRFDMSGFAGHDQQVQLIGQPPMYRGAKPGELTEFVEQHPNAVLLFDEIEKAGLQTIHLFLQVLDAGTLMDQHHDREVRFRDTIIIFTTNGGRKLYDDPDRSGAGTSSRSFHRQTILSALENEKNPETRQPFFPQAICSRMATGYPILFRHLGVTELEQVARAELQRIGGLIGRQFGKQVEFGPLVPLTLVLREGARSDARTLRAQVESFAKTELFQLCQLFDGSRLADVLKCTDRLRYDVEDSPEDVDPAVAALFHMPRKPRVLLVAQPQLAHLYADHLAGIDWRLADQAEDALHILGNEEIDFVLLDLWMRAADGHGLQTVGQFDHAPVAARGLQWGQELLHSIRTRLPEMPLFLLCLELCDATGAVQWKTVDDELLAACMRAGGVRGVLTSRFTDPLHDNSREYQQVWSETLLDAARRVWRENAAARLGQERKVLSFDVVPLIDEHRREIVIRLRKLRLGRALAAADAGEVLDDVERPRVSFDDVVGADEAKQELRFFIDYLVNPRRFAAYGLKPPKGVLLHGPPGTGKTLLARAMAGESDVAFLVTSASTFVTIWQGSGPQSIRDLFARARRYAPAIIFIDEIDAIGKKRTGGSNSQAEEMTHNALLTEMDGFTGPSPTRPVFVLAATNFEIDDEHGSERSARVLDPALVRRFDRKIVVGLPDISARRKYLTLRLAGRPGVNVSDAALDLLAERSSGMNLVKLDEVLEAALRLALRREEPVSTAILEETFESIQFGEARPRTPEEKLRTARHEAGHSVLYWLSGWWPSYVTIVSRGGHGGYMAPSAEESEQGGFSLAQLEAKIRVLLGGRAAETLYYGPAEGLTTGASSDLERATHLARQIVCRFGMDEEFGLLATPELLSSQAAVSSPLYAQVTQAAGRILRHQFDTALQQLEQHRSQLDSLVDLLIHQERVVKEELRKLFVNET